MPERALPFLLSVRDCSDHPDANYAYEEETQYPNDSDLFDLFARRQQAVKPQPKSLRSKVLMTYHSIPFYTSK
jgi:hypothetical protein